MKERTGHLKKRPVLINGDVAYITLTRGYVAVIDAADVPLVDFGNWRASATRDGRTVYAIKGVGINGTRKNKTIFLHREILGLTGSDQADHIDGNGLNNRRSNLRPATNAQNGCNKGRRIDNTSGFKGVSIDAPTGKWRAQITHNRKSFYLGLHQTKEAAYAAYCSASAKYHGEFGRTE